MKRSGTKKTTSIRVYKNLCNTKLNTGSENVEKWISVRRKKCPFTFLTTAVKVKIYVM
jgi:hypothetical protein